MSSRQQPKRPEYRWVHEDYRDKVTLADFYAARLNAPGVIPDIGIEGARLLGGPIEQPRRPMREVCRVPDKRLDQRARKFLTLAAEYAARETFARRRYGPFPTKVHAFALPTSQSPCRPFESGRNVLPGMDEWILRDWA